MRLRVLAVLLLSAFVAAAACGSSSKPTIASASSSTSSSSASASSSAAPSSAVDLTRLPLGDQKFTSSAQKGSVFSCVTTFNGGGAFQNGPWIHTDTNTWDSTAKISVSGSIDQHGEITGTESAGAEQLTGNGLPTTATGVFPVASTDPAFSYDRNPNSIKGYTLQATLPDPVIAATPTCVGGTIGISVLGAPIYSAFDAGGRDAPAHEVQDACDGHPEMTGQYHFHSLSKCWTDTPGFDPGLFGYALDGFGIYVERDASGNLPASADLDECHGRTSEITWHGQKVTMYHYDATADFPYLVGCYKGTPIKSATGLHIGGPG